MIAWEYDSLSIAQFFHTNYSDTPEAVEDFHTFCVKCVMKLETDCR
jgi:hypothetical protein